MLKLNLINSFDGSSIAPEEHHYSINHSGKEIGRAIVFNKDPHSIHESGKSGYSLKDIRLNPEYHGQGIGGQVVQHLVDKYGSLSSDSRGNISEAGHKLFNKFGTKSKDNSGVEHYTMGKSENLIAEHERLVDVLREGSDEEQKKEADKQAKELSEMKKEEIVFAKNGQWSLVKSNYGPKGAGLYDPVANAKRKENNTGDSIDTIGRNKNVKEYTSATQGTAKDQAEAVSRKQAKLNAKQPVTTTLSPELKAKLEAEANKPKTNKTI